MESLDELQCMKQCHQCDRFLFKENTTFSECICDECFVRRALYNIYCNRYMEYMEYLDGINDE